MSKIIERKIVVQGDKDQCGHCEEADEVLGNAHPSEYKYQYEYKENTDLESMPVISDCKTFEDGKRECRKIIGFEPKDFSDIIVNSDEQQ